MQVDGLVDTVSGVPGLALGKKVNQKKRPRVAGVGDIMYTFRFAAIRARMFFFKNISEHVDANTETLGLSVC